MPILRRSTLAPPLLLRRSALLFDLHAATNIQFIAS
ncbi:hypothetical protein A2U01_0104693, partial [Trifolium medium]|nr:hypothetical protein [Trifolium medium]